MKNLLKHQVRKSQIISFKKMNVIFIIQIPLIYLIIHFFSIIV